MPQYRATPGTEDGHPVVRLSETESASEVTVAPTFGANAIDFHVAGKKVLWSPDTLGNLIARPRLCGNPLLAPWANRIAGLSYLANGKKYHLNPDLRNLRLDGNNNPIHGLVTFAKTWRVLDTKATSANAMVKLELDCTRNPDWLAQFPFPHKIAIEYILSAGTLEVVTTVMNNASDPMPLAIGYHPYFQLSDAPRDEWEVTIPATKRLVLNQQLIPTGETTAHDWTNGKKLIGEKLDDGFTDLPNKATFRVKGKSQTIDVVYGAGYPIAVVYAPPGQSYICFEPMTAPTNAFNTPGAAKTIAPGTAWRESYFIRTSGF
jgi:aldose 1-epimerase